MITTLGIYGRINFDPEYDLPKPRILLTLQDGQSLDISSMTEELVSRAKREAQERRNPLAGLVFHVVIPSFPMTVGILKLEVTIGEETYLAGALNFVEAISSSESAPPSQQ